ncbi:hypothetical protein ACLOJK_030686 [Asimina triloba]
MSASGGGRGAGGERAAAAASMRVLRLFLRLIVAHVEHYGKLQAIDAPRIDKIRVAGRSWGGGAQKLLAQHMIEEICGILFMELLLRFA